MSLGFVALGGVGLAAGCGSAFESCAETRTCQGSGDGTGGESSAAGAGHAGEADSQAGAMTSGGTAGGDASVGGSDSSLGGGGGSALLPCDGACAAPKPVCDESSDTCVECLTAGDCTAASGKPQCDTAAKACVECLASSECANAAAAKCDGGACVKCTSNDDCAHVAGKTVCDAGAGECVQCTGKDYASCGLSAGKPLVCDSSTRTCTNTKEHSGGLCTPCVTDAQCALGQLCVKEQFGASKQDVGNFCFWQQGAALGGAPDDCTLPTNRPYVATIKNQTSIDGAPATICGLRTSTCTARNQFSSKDCSTASAADDNKCGFAPTQDSKCLAFGASQFICTMTCGGDIDCPKGFPCDLNAPTPLCVLEP